MQQWGCRLLFFWDSTALMGDQSECNALLFKGWYVPEECQKQMDERKLHQQCNQWLCLEMLTDQKGSNGRGVCTVMLLEWGKMVVH